MAAEGFFSRWARVKAHAHVQGGAAAADAAPADAAAADAAPADAAAADAAPGVAVPALVAPAAIAATAPLSAAAQSDTARLIPTLADAAALTSDADFSAFVGNGVDQAVRRLALKTLFTDPHFNLMDCLDMYMDDYNLASPVSAAMLASLDHARAALRQPQQVLEQLARLAGPAEYADAEAVAAADAEADADADADAQGEGQPLPQPQPQDNDQMQAHLALDLDLAGSASALPAPPSRLVPLSPAAASDAAASPPLACAQRAA